MSGPGKAVVYRVLGTSRQALHQYVKRQENLEQLLLSAESALLLLRRDHHRLGLKKAYGMIQPQGIGRDRFVHWMTFWGHALAVRRSHIKTTRSGRYRYPNLIKGLTINDIGRIWQSDTTYFRLLERFAYLTFIIDVYSRVIVGYCVSSTLAASANLEALQMALRTRKCSDLSELIFHSDGATQYRYGPFVACLGKRGISSSMCDVALDNAYAEKINDVIKNEYLAAHGITTLRQLKYRVKRAVRNYNEVRHHGQLPVRLAPCAYESYLEQCSMNQRPALMIKDGQAKNQEYELWAVQNSLDSSATWVSEGAKQILPSFVKLNQPKENGQLILAL